VVIERIAGEGCVLRLFHIVAVRMVSATSDRSSSSPIGINDIVYVQQEGVLLRGFLMAIVQGEFIVCLDIRHRHLSPGKDGIIIISNREELLPHTTTNTRAWEAEHGSETVVFPWKASPAVSPQLKFKQANKPRSKPWKNLKQILKQESLKEVDLSIPSYLSIQGPPTLKPTKKYCDLTGALAKYTHPRLHIRYSKYDHYAMIENMTRHSIQAYLDMRRANTDIK
jgi:INO80 complex subunit C